MTDLCLDAGVRIELANCGLTIDDLDKIYENSMIDGADIIKDLSTLSSLQAKFIFLSNGICTPKEQLDYALRCGFPKDNWLCALECDLPIMSPHTLPNKFEKFTQDIQLYINDEFRECFNGLEKHHRLLAFLISEYGDGCSPSDIKLRSFSVSGALASSSLTKSMLHKLTDTTDYKSTVQVLDILLSFNPSKALDTKTASRLIEIYMQNGIINC